MHTVLKKCLVKSENNKINKLNFYREKKKNSEEFLE